MISLIANATVVGAAVRVIKGSESKDYADNQVFEGEDGQIIMSSIGGLADLDLEGYCKNVISLNSYTRNAVCQTMCAYSALDHSDKIPLLELYSKCMHDTNLDLLAENAAEGYDESKCTSRSVPVVSTDSSLINAQVDHPSVCPTQCQVMEDCAWWAVGTSDGTNFECYLMIESDFFVDNAISMTQAVCEQHGGRWATCDMFNIEGFCLKQPTAANGFADLDNWVSGPAYCSAAAMSTGADRQYCHSAAKLAITLTQ